MEDRAAIERHLALAETHVVQGERRVAREEAIDSWGVFWLPGLESTYMAGPLISLGFLNGARLVTVKRYCHRSGRTVCGVTLDEVHAMSLYLAVRKPAAAFCLVRLQGGPF